jgi:hypothetical protein
MSLLIGASLALVVGLFATLVGFDRHRAFYPTVMIVVASYYVLFAVMGGSTPSLLTECVVMVPFLVASVAGFKRSLWLVVAGLAGHGALDFVHAHVIANPGVPLFWPDFCMSYDVVAAGYLAALLMIASRNGSEGTRPHSVLGGSEPVDPPRASRAPLSEDGAAFPSRDPGHAGAHRAR